MAQELSFILWLHFDTCSPSAPALQCGLEGLFARAEHVAAPGVAYLFRLQRQNSPGVLLFPHSIKFPRKDGNLRIYKPTSLPMPILVHPRVTENNLISLSVTLFLIVPLKDACGKIAHF